MNRATALCIDAMASSAMAELARLRALVAPYIDLPSSPPPLGEDAAARPSPAAVAPPPETAAATPSPRPAATELRPVQIPAEGAPALPGAPLGAFSSQPRPAGSQASPALSKRDRFRLLWAEGKSAGAIGAELGWKRTTVYTEAYKIGLPQRSYRRQSRPTVSHETPASPDESREAIERFIAEKGATHCPTAVSVAPSHGVTVSPETRAAHVTLAAQREADRVAEQQKRHARKSA